MSKVIGIDLGTSNCCMAIMRNGKVEIIPNSDHENVTPSVVAFLDDGHVIVGKAAAEMYSTIPDKVVKSIKNKMGTEYTVNIKGEKYKPQDISAIILKKLKDDAESYLGESIQDAVITVPAYFNDAQRQATKDAGKIAGLNVLRIINEPTAAALAYGLENGKDEKVMVYDLGGGTFDVSVLDIDDGVFEVLSTGGDTQLGGNDYTSELASALRKKIKDEIKAEPDSTDTKSLEVLAEEIKVNLSELTEVTFSIPSLKRRKLFKTETVSYTGSIKKNEFGDITKRLTDKTLRIANDVMKQSGLNINSINNILLVGGSTRMSSIPEAIEKRFGKKPLNTLNPDECVAIGAAIQADRLSGGYELAIRGKSDIVLLDVIPITIMILTENKGCLPVIKKNTSIPTSSTDRYLSELGTSTSIDVYQGESNNKNENIHMGSFRISHTRVRNDNERIPIDITFTVDENGIIDVSAIERKTNNKAEIKLDFNSRMSVKQIEQSKNNVLSICMHD